MALSTRAVAGREGGRSWTSPSCTSVPHILVPDLAGWRRTRLPGLPETAWFELAPDWICEVLSPGMAVGDRAEKLPIYAEQGVAHVWLIDPQPRTLWKYSRTTPESGACSLP